MNKEPNLNSEFYMPVCSIDDCNGILKLDFDLNNFKVNYKCEKNKEHIGENISLENFKKFNIKKKRINKCSKCSLNLENEWEYKCYLCDKLYCPMCLFDDEHIKFGANVISKRFNKCQLHNYAKNNYCIDCCEHMCDLCKINETCRDHNVKNVLEIIPSINKINSLEKKIKEMKIYTQNVIISLDKWLIKLSENINSLKQNLELTIEIFEQLFTNFSQQFLNYHYQYNFTYFTQLIDNNYNDFLNKFYNSKSFEEQTRNLFEILGHNREEIKEKNANLKELNNFNNGNGKLTKINDDYFFYFSDIKNVVNISFYLKDKESQKDSIYYFKNSRIEFKDIIYSISPSINLKKIYVCLQNKKIIKIFDLDLENETMKLSDEQIKSKASIPNDHYNKCIELGNDLLATADNYKISVWKRNRKSFIRTSDLKFSEKPFDLLLVNNNYFITSLYLSKVIIFISTERNEIIDEIKNIDTVCSEECFILYKDYIIVNCIKGFALISTETKKLIKYINNFEGYFNKKLCIDSKDYLYILGNNNNTSIMKIRFDEDNLVPTEKYENLRRLNDEDNLEENALENIFINNEEIIVWGKAIYILSQIVDKKEEIPI